MTVTHIRSLAICLFRHRGRLLVFEQRDSVTGDRLCRPLGGGIEFGERGRDAIAREIREELGAEIEDVTWLGTLENLFTLDGLPRHEIVLVYDARFVDRALYDRDEIPAQEPALGINFTAVWLSPEELAARGVRLVPEGLREFLEEQDRCPRSRL